MKKNRKVSIAILVAGVVVGTTIWFAGTPGSRDPDRANSPGVSRNTSDSAIVTMREEETDQFNGVPQSVREVDLEQLAGPIEQNIRSIRLHELYDEYAMDADSGDLDAILVLVSVFEECRNIRSPATLVDRLGENGLPAEMIAAEEERYQRCALLLERAPDVDGKLQEQYAVLQDTQHPLFMVRRQLSDPITKKEILTYAVLYDHPIEHILSRAFTEASLYHSIYPEHRDHLRSEAWALLACETNWHCDGADLRDRELRERFVGHEFDEIIRIKQAIVGAINSRDPTALGY